MRRSDVSFIALAALALACSIPGIAPEDRDVRVTHTELPVPPLPVHERASQLLVRHGYVLVRTQEPEFVRGERMLANDRVNVIEVRIAGTVETSRAELHGWTETGGIGGRRKAAQYDESLSRDVQAVSQGLSCPTAAWPTCP